MNVEGKTRQVGSLIDGGFTLKTKEYEYKDLEDMNKSRNIGINLTITPGVVDIYRNGRLTGEAAGGVSYGTRINFDEKDYVAKVKTTIGENVNVTVDGNELSERVNRDIAKRVEVIRDREVRPINADLGTEYWATDYGREKTNTDFSKAGNKIERVSEILKAVIENDNKDIALYYRDRLDYEAERDRKEREGQIEKLLIDREKAKEIVERASGEEIDDLQILSTKDPNIKEIIGVEGLRGRAYHIGKGKVVIIADNIEDYAKAIGVLTEEGRHLYHRRENDLKNSEEYASFYGRQFERYYDRQFDDKTASFITERLKYTKEQLGNDWENDVRTIFAAISGELGYYIAGKGTAILGIAEGDNKEIKYFGTIAGGVGIGAGGGVSVSVGGAYFNKINSPDELAGWGNSISLNFIGGISGSFSAEFSKSAAGFLGSLGTGGPVSGTVTYQLGYTYVGKNISEVLNKLPISSKNKEILKKELDKAKKGKK